MDLNGLPADVAQFVDDALASGKYPSAEALVAAALQVLQQQEEDRGTPRPAAASEAGSVPASPDDYLQALAVQTPPTHPLPQCELKPTVPDAWSCQSFHASPRVTITRWCAT
jgi:Arc/MetJ-type ribon-helix-helix transcriptional regulator